MKKLLCFFAILTSISFPMLSMERPEVEEEEWIFLRKFELDRPNKEASDWRIRGKRFLELKADAEDVLSQEKFTKLIKEAQKKHIPYILIALPMEDFYYFYDGTTFLLNLGRNWTHPELRKRVSGVAEIYVVGEDGILTFLWEMNQLDIMNNFFAQSNLPPPYGILKVPYELNKGYEKPGYGHLLIAKLFNKKVEEPEKIEKKINKNLKILQGVSEQDVASILKNIQHLESIKKTIIQRIPILQQYARQWFVWAIKYLKDFEHPRSSILAEAKRNRDKIPYKPELLRVEREAPDPLTKSLKNLTVKLRRLSEVLS